MATDIRTGFRPQDICVVGLGYIGLPTAAILASRGHSVLGVDSNPGVVETISRGAVHIVEPDLDLLVKTGVHSGRLKAASEPAQAEVFVLCVPTPFHPETRSPNIEYVRLAAHAIAPHVRPGNLVILESTSPPGTTVDVVGGALRAAGLEPGKDVHLAHCPERVLPGAILRECVENDRVIGGYTEECAKAAREFYATFVSGNIRLTDCKTAETVKLVENASRDVQIAFANELSLLCDDLGLDVWEVIALANRHPRVSILQPGPGVGGHCIAVDPWFLVAASPGTTHLIRAARERNDAMPERTAERIRRAAKETRTQTVALLGMAYKNDIDDCRESPSLEVYRLVREALPGVRVVACEPYVTAIRGVELVPFEQCLADAGVIALLVAHRPFRDYDWSALPPDRVLLDFKGVLNKA